MKSKKKLIIIIVLLIVIFLLIGLFVFINSHKSKEKKESLDKMVPTITVIEEQIIIDGDTEFDPLKNVEVKFGKSGGKTTCDKEKLEVGENIITCTAVGNNKLEAKATYKVNMSKTLQKSAIFFGDSIVYGFLSNGYSWANYIGDNYDLKSSVNAGISDYRVSTYDNANKWLVNEVKGHYNDPENYDFVILQGGVNDVLYNTPIGNISNSKDINSFDPRTFCGGLESYLYYVTNKWPNSRIGYIITYYTPNYTERGIKWSYNDYKVYYDKTIEILDKWNIKYINLASDEYNNILRVEEKTYLPDYLHLNRAGYEVVSPYIYEFMQTLDKYQ